MNVSKSTCKLNIKKLEIYKIDPIKWILNYLEYSFI